MELSLQKDIHEIIKAKTNKQKQVKPITKTKIKQKARTKTKKQANKQTNKNNTYARVFAYLL